MTWPQEAHADLGLIDDDHTETPSTSPAKNQIEGDRFNPYEGD